MKERKDISNFYNGYVYIFGAGFCGKNYCNILAGLGFNIKGFIDNDNSKHGKKVQNKMVYSLNDITLKENECIIVAVLENYDSIFEQLSDRGIKIELLFSIKELQESEWLRHKIDSIMCADVLRTISFKQNIRSEKIIRIFYDAQCFTMQKTGGISRYISEIANGIANNDGVDVTVLEGVNISSHEFDSRVNIPVSLKLDRALLNDLYIRNRINSKLTNRYLEDAGTVDIYHPTYYEDYEVTGYRKKIITVHDMIHELFNMDEETINKKKKSISSSDGIIAVSENTKKDLVRILNVPDEMVRVIYHGNSLNIDVSNDERIIKNPYILYVGNRSGYKNFELLVDAFSKSLFSKELCLISFGGAEFNKHEKCLMDSLGLTEKVIHMAGNDRMLANLYANAEIFVYPSLYEGFGLPILEAMHYGTPVITANTSSLPEVAGNAADYFDPRSSEELQIRIDSLLNDKDRRKLLSKAGVDREKEFSWKKAVKETLKYYKQVLEI